MKVIVYLLALSHIAICTYCILYTRETLDVLKGWFRTYPLRYLSVIPALYAVLYLITATVIIYPWVFRLIGLLALCEAVVAYTDPSKVYSRMLDWYFEKASVRANQFFGIIGIIFATLILTWVR